MGADSMSVPALLTRAYEHGVSALGPAVPTCSRAPPRSNNCKWETAATSVCYDTSPRVQPSCACSWPPPRTCRRCISHEQP